MKNIKPELDNQYDMVECPIFNEEWGICNINGTKCPTKEYDDDENCTYFFPINCPAKEGIIIKI